MILQLSEKALESHYSLSMNSIRSHPKETSLIHETIVRFLYSYSTPLKNISEGRLSFHGRGHEDELLREAGSWLMRTTERAIGDHGSISLFHACNAISSLRYEGSESVGRMIVSSPDHLNVNISVHLQKSISMDNFRGIRKLLELASGEMHLLCDSRGIYGVGKLTEIPYDENAEDLFIVEFTGHHTWILLHAEHQLMVVRYGLPSLPSRPIDDKTFRNQTKAVFPRLTEEDLDGLWSIVNAASRQKHGTMFVISDHAEQEAKRLKNQSTPIKPVQLTPEMILPLSSIDGALLIDPKSVCYSIGIILDGVATEKGDPGRGARDNSAIRYHDLANKQKHKCLIVVISEDGMIDLIGNMFGA